MEGIRTWKVYAGVHHNMVMNQNTGLWIPFIHMMDVYDFLLDQMQSDDIPRTPRDGITGHAPNTMQTIESIGNSQEKEHANSNERLTFKSFADRDSEVEQPRRLTLQQDQAARQKWTQPTTMSEEVVQGGSQLKMALGPDVSTSAKMPISTRQLSLSRSLSGEAMLDQPSPRRTSGLRVNTPLPTGSASGSMLAPLDYRPRSEMGTLSSPVQGPLPTLDSGRSSSLVMDLNKPPPRIPLPPSNLTSELQTTPGIPPRSTMFPNVRHMVQLENSPPRSPVRHPTKPPDVNRASPRSTAGYSPASVSSAERSKILSSPGGDTNSEASLDWMNFPDVPPNHQADRSPQPIPPTFLGSTSRQTYRPSPDTNASSSEIKAAAPATRTTATPEPLQTRPTAALRMPTQPSSKPVRPKATGSGSNAFQITSGWGPSSPRPHSSIQSRRPMIPSGWEMAEGSSPIARRSPPSAQRRRRGQDSPQRSRTSHRDQPSTPRRQRPMSQSTDFDSRSRCSRGNGRDRVRKVPPIDRPVQILLDRSLSRVDLSEPDQKWAPYISKSLDILSKGFTDFVRYVFTNTFGELWSCVIMKPAPWSGSDILALLQRHWSAVFCNVMSDLSMDLVYHLRQIEREIDPHAVCISDTLVFIHYIFDLFRSFRFVPLKETPAIDLDIGGNDLVPFEEAEAGFNQSHDLVTQLCEECIAEVQIVLDPTSRPATPITPAGPSNRSVSPVRSTGRIESQENLYTMSPDADVTWARDATKSMSIRDKSFYGILKFVRDMTGIIASTALQMSRTIRNDPRKITGTKQVQDRISRVVKSLYDLEAAGHRGDGLSQKIKALLKSLRDFITLVRYDAFQYCKVLTNAEDWSIKMFEEQLFSPRDEALHALIQTFADQQETLSRISGY